MKRLTETGTTSRSIAQSATAWALGSLVALSLGCAELAGLQLPIGFPGGPLDEGTVAAGLRQALEVGTQRASGSLSQTGGFSGNPLLRIALPSELDNVAKGLRSVGFGQQVDDFEIVMNRAAERAVGEAVPVFANAVREMSIADAFGILNGPENAATEYFKGRTSDALRARFAPIAEAGMREVGVYAQYQSIVSKVKAIPFLAVPTPDLEAHVTERALSGLFSRLAEEEAKIRTDPTARSTALLQRVFGR